MVLETVEFFHEVLHQNLSHRVGIGRVPISKAVRTNLK